jgi:multiple sugar transport system ATP-binding protein
MAVVEMKSLRKQFGGLVVLHGIDLAIGDGEFVVLVGPSGCGKSTLLRMVAGLESVSGGELHIGGRLANDLPPQRRNIAMVFQSYALYPHLSAYENMAFGPRLRREAPEQIDGSVRRAAGTLNIGAYLERLPRALSGGQRQRVAMGRAIVRHPDLFLFDEPLSNLDAKLRVQMRTEIRALHLKLKTTTIYVTHDQVEAMTMADRIVVMNHGRIEQSGDPLALYDEPANLFVAGFLGSPTMGFVEGTLSQRDGRSWLRTEANIELPAPIGGAEAGRKVVMGIRPEHLQLSDAADSVPATVLVVEPTGAETHLYTEIGGTRLCALLRNRVRLAPGDAVRLGVDAAQVHLFDAETGLRIAA